MNLLGWFFERFFLLFLDSIAVVWLRVVHQLFFPFVSEPDEHVLAGTLQAFGVVLDKPDETLDIVVFFEVNGQYVTQWPFLLVALRLAEWKRSVLKVKRIATYNQSPQYYRVCPTQQNKLTRPTN